MRTLFRYTWRSLAAQPVLVASAAAVAVVVAGFLVTMGMARGMARTIVTTAELDNVMVTSGSSHTEVASSVTRTELAALRELAGDQATVSPELIHLMFFDRKDGGSDNLVVRGITPAALNVHPSVRIVQGRAPRAGHSEVMVGRRVAEGYAGCEPGKTLRFGRRAWTIVGVFAAGGNSFESELWNSLEDYFQDSFSFNYSLAVVRAHSPAGSAALVERFGADPRLSKLRFVPELVYFMEQRGIVTQLEWLAAVTVAVLALAAFATVRYAVAASTARRALEVRAANALGLRKPHLLAVLLAQALAIAGLGILVGVAGGLLMRGAVRSYASFNTYATLLFPIDLAPPLVLEGVLIGLALVLASTVASGSGILWRQQAGQRGPAASGPTAA